MCFPILKVQSHCLYLGIASAENDSIRFLPVLSNSDFAAAEVFLIVL